MGLVSEAIMVELGWMELIISNHNFKKNHTTFHIPLFKRLPNKRRGHRENGSIIEQSVDKVAKRYLFRIFGSLHKQELGHSQ